MVQQAHNSSHSSRRGNHRGTEHKSNFRRNGIRHVVLEEAYIKSNENMRNKRIDLEELRKVSYDILVMGRGEISALIIRGYPWLIAQ